MATTQDPAGVHPPAPQQPDGTTAPTKHETFVHSYGADLGLDRPDCTCPTCKATRSYLDDGSIKDVKRNTIIYPAGEVRRDAHGDLVWLRKPGHTQPTPPASAATPTPPVPDALRAQRALLRTVIEGANAPLLAKRAELDAKLATATEQLEELLKEPAIVTAQQAVTALKEENAALDAQLQSVYDALAALDAPPPAPDKPTPKQKDAAGKTEDRTPMRFFQEFNKYYRKSGVNQKTLTARCKAAGIDQSDRSEANIDLAYACLLEAGEIA